MASFATSVQKNSNGPAVSLQSAFMNPTSLGFKPVDNPDAGAQATAGMSKIEAGAAAISALSDVKAQLQAAAPETKPEPGSGGYTAGMVGQEMTQIAMFTGMDMMFGGGIGAAASAAAIAVSAGKGLMASLNGMGSDAVIMNGIKAESDYAATDAKINGKDQPSAFEQMASNVGENLLATAGGAIGGLSVWDGYKAAAPIEAEGEITLAVVNDRLDQYAALTNRGFVEAASGGVGAEEMSAHAIAAMGSFADEAEIAMESPTTPRPSPDFVRQFQPGALAPAAFQMA